MKKINIMLTKCKTLSTQLIRTSSHFSPRSKSTTTTTDRPADAGGIILSNTIAVTENESQKTIYVGSTRKPYVIDSEYLSHPLVNALIQKSTSADDNDNGVSVIKCEVVLFDHLLWMPENSDLNLGSDSVDELADLYLVN